MTRMYVVMQREAKELLGAWCEERSLHSALKAAIQGSEPLVAQAASYCHGKVALSKQW